MHVKRKTEDQEGLSGDQHSRIHNRRKCICLSATVSVIAGALFILILLLTVFRSKKPITTVNSVALNDVHAYMISLTPPKLSLNVTLDISISVKNPNKVGITYGNSTAALRYHGEDIGNAPIAAGTIGSDTTKKMNVTVTVFADRLVEDLDIDGDVLGGDLPLSTYTRITSKVRILNLFNIHVVSTSRCNIKVDILNRNITDQRCN